MRDTAEHLRETDEVQQGKEDEETVQLLELNTVMRLMISTSDDLMADSKLHIGRPEI